MIQGGESVKNRRETSRHAANISEIICGCAAMLKKMKRKKVTSLLLAMVLLLVLTTTQGTSLVFAESYFTDYQSVAMVGGGEVFNIGTALPAQGTNWNFEYVTHFNHNIPVGYVTVPTLFVNDGASLTITGASGAEQNRRVVVNGTAHITLDNASIIRTGDAIRISAGTNPATYVNTSPMMLESGANLTLTLVGDNTLAMATGAGNRWSAGLGVPLGADLIIEGEGSLTVEGGLNAAGIGGHEGTHLSPRVSGSITINSGTINATGRGNGAGIGGGSLMQPGRITINGGDVTARGGTGGNFGGSGIGSGSSAGTTANNNAITINGGTVTAIGGAASAGIGGGTNTSAGTINITSGTVTATGGSSALRGGAGIGGGDSGNGGSITITGGTITAVGGSNNAGTSGGGAGIGSGAAMGSAPGVHSGNINITGGTISATGGPNAQNIGSSKDSAGIPRPGGSVTIGEGANVI